MYSLMFAKWGKGHERSAKKAINKNYCSVFPGSRGELRGEVLEHDGSRRWCHVREPKETST